jgi:hypothetical protein
MKSKRYLIAVLCAVALASTNSHAQTPPQMKMTTPIPPSITTPDSVDTRIGTLKFFDGFPDDKTTQLVYDNLYFMRGVEAFLLGIPGASIEAFIPAAKEFGGVDGNVMIFEDRMDSKALWLTANNSSVYFLTWIDTTNGPIVMETPPNVLGVLDDHWFRWIGDYGNAGPDKGQGGKFLFLPPGYKGEVPKGYFVVRSTTYGVWAPGRGMLVNGDPKPAVESIKKLLKIYPLAQAANPPVTKFTNMSGIPHNTIHSNDFHFYEEIHAILEMEPNEALDPVTLGVFASIGLQKGKPFAPDGRMTKILTESAAVGNATARALASGVATMRATSTRAAPGGFRLTLATSFCSNPACLIWTAAVPFTTGPRASRPRCLPRWWAKGRNTLPRLRTAHTKRSTAAKRTRCICRPTSRRRTTGPYTLYDNQTRSCLQTDQRFPSVNSFDNGLVTNPDGSTDVWFGPTLPQGVAEANWAQTIPGKGWNMLFRLYGVGWG